MQYIHAFHAGNFADVHKHIAVLQVISALQKKPKGFLYLDTHAGAGMYDLASGEARRAGESDAGIERLLSAARDQALHPAIRQYVDVLSRLRAEHGNDTFMESFHPDNLELVRLPLEFNHVSDHFQLPISAFGSARMGVKNSVSW